MITADCRLYVPVRSGTGTTPRRKKLRPGIPGRGSVVSVALRCDLPFLSRFPRSLQLASIGSDAPKFRHQERVSGQTTPLALRRLALFLDSSRAEADRSRGDGGVSALPAGNFVVGLAVGLCAWLLVIETMSILERRGVLREKDSLRIIANAVAAFEALASDTPDTRHSESQRSSWIAGSSAGTAMTSLRWSPTVQQAAEREQNETLEKRCEEAWKKGLLSTRSWSQREGPKTLARFN